MEMKTTSNATLVNQESPKFEDSNYREYPESAEQPDQPQEDVHHSSPYKNPDFPHSYGFKEDKSLWTKFTVPIFGEIRFNPIVSFTAIIIIWAFVALCGSLGELVPFNAWKSWLVDHFTWLYIGIQDGWAVFMIVLYTSKYSGIKLGKSDDKPEYSDSTWFMMLFACGIGTGLFFYGVAEPLFHYVGPNRYTADPTTPENTLAQIAINLTLFHWGIHGWIVYSLVGLLLALLAYRENLPMTMKSCFYPLLGDRIFGWMGDLIDVVSIITTLFGVCTSLGLGTRQLNVGLTMLNSDIPADDLTIQIIIIWCITAVATISTVSGVGMGIRRLSETCFMVGMFLMIVALLVDDTFFILNLYVQSLGYYIQWIIQLGFHTDAWEQLDTMPSESHAIQTRWLPEGVTTNSGPSDWIDNWTMFYWGWWISWCPFVGMFIAKISKGRTIKQFINGTLTAPVLYTFFWMVIFGGAGLRLERGAQGNGYCCPDSQGWVQNVSSVETIIKERGLVNQTVAANSSYFLCEGGDCGSCAYTVLDRYDENNQTYGLLLTDYQNLDQDFGSVSPGRKLARISCHSIEQMWFDLMRSYGDIGGFLSIFSLLGIILYFVTSSDSGSLVIDCLSANGDPDPPRLQRVFWALMEGATATALLVAGGKDGLTALQSAGLLSGLPYIALVTLICVSIWRTCQVAAGDLDPEGPTFAIGLYDPFACQPYHEIAKNLEATFKLFLGFLKNIILAPLTVAQAHGRVTGNSNPWAMKILLCLSLGLFVVLHLLQLVFDGAWAMAWFFYLVFAAVACTVRMEVRERFQIHGSAFEDLFVALILYPNCALQMDLTTQILEDDPKGGKSGTEDAHTPRMTRGSSPTIEIVGLKANGNDNPAFQIGIEK
ncbi:hypothetical protein TCAL_12618 [Tigriopus californicus]|uniref:Uncharacterized protein n=1 Tax=Tigriopus californicus TaxID=6832 RepID=A0A553NS16_TIGCA|nr:uncharacterized protein LOC131887866 [Tigriopus californicus]XP_059092578.1 uncharacterized protein LOC131887866 [Tigriopus californicus]XP_059092587.1 uncharacterized protein LOC131887866 [Tigriopus californicus]XP_059092596.1 uncharacterized protein LOC131887866 [Tigriopus californicus]TRY68223.1 hypothetical protein TCAL_12618 [Tigriopus californicus]|eukprot:TCALIF_12618-PA protein Name:"Similar to HI_1706 Uncharacterized transporter HI_1706 (Haemophilus influenzae (strain ATCC 51907 / DSM 11121 / KW20 / Rd))" AED:0.06 eAED:0.06 QI:109/1/1/1/0.75/0.55/9/234/880